jgi:cellulose biosynthesis protein BcsQ
MPVISVYSSKGGVGKSTLSSYIALTINQIKRDAKILVIDLCQNSSIAGEFGKNRETLKYTTFEWYKGECKDAEVIQRFGKTNVYFIPSSNTVDEIVPWTEKMFKVGREKKLAQRLKPLTKHFDYIILDNHPNENDDKSVYSVVASDHVVFAMDLSPKSIRATLRDYEFFKDIQEEFSHLDYSIAPNRVETTKGDLPKLKETIAFFTEKGIPEDKILPYIRYSKLIKGNEIFDLIREKKLTNQYVRNVLSDFETLTVELVKRMEQKEVISVGE